MEDFQIEVSMSDPDLKETCDMIYKSGYDAGWYAGYEAGYLAADSYIQNESESAN